MLRFLNKYNALLVKILFLTLALLTFYIVFYNLGKAPLDNWDEAWYGEMTKNMIATGDFIIPHWNQTVLLDKAPLYMWITIFFSTFIGLSEFSLRLTSAISASFVIFLVTFYAYKKYGLIPSLVAYFSIALNNLFIFRARSGNLDSLPTLLILLSYFVIISKHKYRLVLLAVLFAFIYLTRAAFVAFPLSVFFIHELLFRKSEIIHTSTTYLLSFIIFFSLTGWWLWLGYIREGMPFINYYVFHSDQGTARVSLEYFKLDYFQYAYYSLQRRLFYLFILGVLFLIVKIKKPEYLLQLFFSTSLLILLTFSHRTDNWYLTPSMPFWSLVIAYATYTLIKLLKPFKIAPLLIVLAVSYISYRTFTQNIVPILYTISAVGEADSGKYLKAHSAKNDIVVRLDHLYPTLIYYSDRKVLVSTLEASTGGYFLSRTDLTEFIEQKKIKWVVGQKAVTDNFVQENSDLKYQRIQINPDEYILKFL